MRVVFIIKMFLIVVVGFMIAKETGSVFYGPAVMISLFILDPNCPLRDLK